MFDTDAAALAYVTWALARYGAGRDPDDELVRRYYLRWWMARCVKPRWLAHAGVLTEGETQTLAGDRWAWWGRPGRCRSRFLDPAADVPPWLACCRAEPRHGTA